MKTTKPEISVRCLAAALIATSSLSFATPEMVPESPQEISDFIKMDISSDSRMQGTRIEVALHDGIVRLTGHVNTLDQAERAAERSMAATKVRAVVNELEIGGAAASDSALKAAVRSALDKNKALGAGHIKVAASNGRVILSGSVSTWDEQEIAREAVSSVPGVKAIENKTEVVFEDVRLDTQIAEQLRQMIANDPLCDGLSLSVSVKEGVVKLRGELGSKGEYDRLVRRSSVTGVFEVNADGLNINSDLKMEAVEDKHFTPEQMMAALGDAMKADPRIDPSLIQSQLDEGIVTLSGEVPAEEMKMAAESTTRGVPGVIAVNNQIRIGEAAARPLVSVSAPVVVPQR